MRDQVEAVEEQEINLLELGGVFPIFRSNRRIRRAWRLKVLLTSEL